ncbi:hypothetical protein SMACR_12764 [Sordaria macrospora]|uniref:WGS project CABT00000000 data, contig 2.31 n=2 Tax=Sordaria macrospora TaxID=5147 RepID=F7W5R9_SORMK|nr:uncharacterized protein SMAC_12764 [Sordaria macrospora k-hell]KAA8635531.1 hypothetical protein SMACR_12764 [Sordaria macrospora]KAH7629512.1 hypothetical protein B0T09DRAFT_343263 [Sordaria sp. MPI-SDFR-AT-0083]WPJ66274.1 hypothetical protein SMAC4_12764 [Sordaria macrospora]CCC12857.1 unnamed protein product [Sordaria macrospora k-hell]
MQPSLVFSTLATLNVAVVAALLSTFKEDALVTRDNVKPFGTKICVDVNFRGLCQTFSNTTTGLGFTSCIRLDDSLRGLASSVEPFENTLCHYYMLDRCELPNDNPDNFGCAVYGVHSSIPDLKTKAAAGISWGSKCNGIKNMDKQIRSFRCFPNPWLGGLPT